MAFDIVFTDSAKRHYRELDAGWKSMVKQAIESHLRHDPARISKSRIKRLRDMRHPEYRLRVDDYRVFYDIHDTAWRVVILAIVPKRESESWLLKHGTSNL